MGWRKVVLPGMMMAGLVFAGCDVQQAQNLSQVKEAPGKRLFEENCAGCHGITGHGSSMMTVHFDDAAFHKTRTDEALITTIKNGRGMMPAFETSFNETELKELVSYLRSLPPQSSKHPQ